jgi:hypothetical protein
MESDLYGTMAIISPLFHKTSIVNKRGALVPGKSRILHIREGVPSGMVKGGQNKPSLPTLSLCSLMSFPMALVPGKAEFCSMLAAQKLLY